MPTSPSLFSVERWSFTWSNSRSLWRPLGPPRVVLTPHVRFGRRACLPSQQDDAEPDEPQLLFVVVFVATLIQKAANVKETDIRVSTKASPYSQTHTMAVSSFGLKLQGAEVAGSDERGAAEPILWITLSQQDGGWRNEMTT